MAAVIVNPATWAMRANCTSHSMEPRTNARPAMTQPVHPGRPCRACARRSRTATKTATGRTVSSSITWLEKPSPATKPAAARRRASKDGQRRAIQTSTAMNRACSA